MKRFPIILAATLICVPAMAQDGPPDYQAPPSADEIGTGNRTAYFVGAQNPKRSLMIVGNGKVIGPGVGKWTAEMAQEPKPTSDPE